MGLLSGIFKAVGNIVSAPLKLAAGVTAGVANGISSIFGGGEQQQQAGPMPQGPSIFGGGPRPWGPPPPPHFHPHHGPHFHPHHGPFPHHPHHFMG